MKKVIVGISGGVDSAAIAGLLMEKGYEVIGLNVVTHREASVEDAKKVAETLGIKLLIKDGISCFKEHVSDNFVNEYLCGKTPSPCIECNRFVKFKFLYEAMLEEKADFIATGHYARVKVLENGRYSLANAASAEKDQTYFLYMLSQDILSRVLFPAGEYSKEEIREYAEKSGIPVAKKPDSMELCFVPDDDYKAYIESNSEACRRAPGHFASKDGKILGKHKGLYNYTVGQRKGLGIALGKPAFVISLDPAKNTVVLGENEDLMTDTVYLEEVFFMAQESIEDGTRAFAKIRYNHRGADCTLFNTSKGLKAVFDAPVRAATPGQSLVAYIGDCVLAGGKIVAPEMS